MVVLARTRRRALSWGISFIGYTPIHAGAVNTDPVMGDCVEGNYSARITQPRMVKMLVLKTGLFYIIELMRKRSDRKSVV